MISVSVDEVGSSTKTNMTATIESAPSANKPTIKTVVSDFGGATTLHGVQYVTGDGWIPFRLIWLLICVVFTVVFAIQASVIIREFFTYPYSTKIEIASRPRLGFPAVTVCNANRLRRSKLIDTRFEGLIEIDGGISGADYDYSWWFSAGYAFDSSTSYTNDSQASNSSLSSSFGGTDSPSSSPSAPVGRRKRSVIATPERRAGIMESRSLPDDDFGSPEDSPVPSSYQRPPGDTTRVRREGSREARNTIPSSLFSWYDPNEDSNFYYYDDGWDAVTAEDDWQGFYANSRADDYSDLIEVIKPTKTEIIDYGHQLEDFVLQCTFDRRPCNISQTFTMWQNKYYGNCFTFNSAVGGLNQTRSTGKTGALNGLHLTLFVEQPEYVGILSPHTGAKVVIHDPQVQAFPEEDAVDLPTGMATSIGITQEYIDRLGGKYTNCTTDGANTNFTASSSSSSSSSPSFSYSTVTCRKACFQRYLSKYCECVDDNLFEDFSAPLCSVLNSTQQWCRQYIDEQFIEDRLECSCPSPCNETKYTKTVSAMLWPSERYEEHLYTRITAPPGREKVARILQTVELTRKNFLRLKVYYEELNYQYVKQVPVYSFTSLMGNVGGLMGLYIGMSFMSIFEVLFLVIRILNITFRKICCRNSVQPPKN